MTMCRFGYWPKAALSEQGVARPKVLPCSWFSALRPCRDAESKRAPQTPGRACVRSSAHHLVDRVTLRRILIVERPRTFRARPTLPELGFDPNHASLIHFVSAFFAGRLGNSAAASRSSTESGAKARRALASTVACCRTFSATATGTCSTRVFCLCMTAASFGCLHRNNLPVIRGESIGSLRLTMRSLKAQLEGLSATESISPWSFDCGGVCGV